RQRNCGENGRHGPRRPDKVAARRASAFLPLVPAPEARYIIRRPTLAGDSLMQTVIWGIVKDGKIIPEKPLPEGISVQITLPPAVPPDLQEELDAWACGSAQALDLVERLAEEGTKHEER